MFHVEQNFSRHVLVDRLILIMQHVADMFAWGGSLLDNPKTHDGSDGYTIGQINACIPKIASLMCSLLCINAQLKPLLDDLIYHGIDLASPIDTLMAQTQDILLHDLLSDVSVLASAAQNKVDALLATGAHVDDLNLGRLLWPAKTQCGGMFWCWQFGEPEICFWRKASEPFDARRALAVSAASLV